MNKRKKGCVLDFILLAIANAIIIFLFAVAFSFPNIEDVKQVFIKKTDSTVSIQSLDLEDRYYYQQLNETDKSIYREICQGIRDMETSIYVNSTDYELVHEILQDVLKDYPEYFWCEGNIFSSQRFFLSHTLMRPVYNCTENEKILMQKQIDLAVSECLSEIDSESSDYDKIVYVYEYIINHTDFNSEAEHNQNIYSVFVNGESVCAGYAKSTGYLLRQLGVPSILVFGTAQDEPHAWNIVECEGEYYHIDTTWGDPIFKDQEIFEGFKNIDYEFLCCTDEEIFKTHTPDERVNLPVCNSLKWYYYFVNGMYYDRYDETIIVNAMVNDLEKRSNQSVFKFASSDVYSRIDEKTLSDLVQRALKNVYSMNGTLIQKYYYQFKPDFNKIKIFWIYK